MPDPIHLTLDQIYIYEEAIALAKIDEHLQRLNMAHNTCPHKDIRKGLQKQIKSLEFQRLKIQGSRSERLRLG